MRFACFGGAAAVADEAVAAARHRNRGTKSFFGNKAEKSPKSSSSSPWTNTKRMITSPGRRRETTDFDVYMLAAGKSASVPSSSAQSTAAASLDSSFSSSRCSSRSSSSSSLSTLDAMTPPQPQPAARKRVQRPDGVQKGSPAAGAAAVLVCLVMLTFGGRFVATLLTAAVLCFFPRRWPASARATAAERMPCGVPSSPERVVASRRDAGMINTRAVTDGFLIRNRNKF